MKFPVIALALFVAGIAVAQDKSNTLTRAEKSEGWRLLFDGRSLNGWEARPTSAATTNGDWKVQDGSIVCPGTSPGWLATTATFSDYHLKLQFRGSEKVNSGVFLRSQKEGQPHITGYELQIWDYQPAGYSTGSLVNTIKAPPTKILGDEWNNYDITADGDHYVIVLNGKTLLDTHDSAHRSGVIGFQCQKDNKIEFRGIKVLPKSH
ncbi:MAG TPA: DUF1080 domain-containing protein [Bryobacteraceae bacterium]|nr:DUF1080 domain-containing protein [Bryobacteraceae bacterium]